jgi:uncharacterized protein
LNGETPRLLDEWQVHDEIWNYVRHEVDNRKKKGQFILTGSANPNDDTRMHSGAGRFTIIKMDTLSWLELGYSNGSVKLSDLINGKTHEFYHPEVQLEFILDKIIIGGWPTLLYEEVENAIKLNSAYIDLLCEVDMSRVSVIKRDPIKVRSLIKSLSRNIGTTVDNNTLERDVKMFEKNDISRNTISEYLDTLSRLMILYEQPAFNLHIRSVASLRKSPKRHLCDPSLAVAALGLDREALLKDLNFAGFLFKSLVVHDLNVYAKANDARVFHYQDSYGLEIDAIVQKPNGQYAPFEIKLGTGFIDQAAENLMKFEKNIDISKAELPSSLNIITGTGISYRRADGINVISLAALGV